MNDLPPSSPGRNFNIFWTKLFHNNHEELLKLSNSQKSESYVFSI